MKTRVISSNYDKDTGVSTVTILTDRGEFTGVSRLQESDKDVANMLAGGSNAEWKASMKYIKARIAEIKIQLKMLQDFEKRLKHLADYNPYTIECRKLRKQIYEKKAELKDWQGRLESSHAGFMSMLEQRDKFVHSISIKGKNS